MNNVSFVGKIIKVWDVTTTEHRQHVAAGHISIPRPYKIGGKFKFDVFTIRGWDKLADRLMCAKPGQIVGVTGILEIDDENKVYLNIKTLFFYSYNEQAEINESCVPDEQIEALSGFAGIQSSDIPDF